MSRRKRNPILTRGLRSLFLGRPSAESPWKLHLTFWDTWGTADSRGREVVAYLNLHDLAEAVRRAQPAVGTNDQAVLARAEAILHAAGGPQ